MPAQQHQTASTPARLRDRPSWLISRAYARASSVLNEAFEVNAGGLRSYDYRLLAALDEWGPASQADLGRATGIDRSDVTAAIVELETRGLIERTIDPDHRRRNVVSMTSSGVKQLAKLDRVVTDVQDELLASLNPLQRKQLVALLHRMLD